MEVAQELKEIVMKHSKAMALALIEKVAVRALKEAAQKTATPVDDLVVEALAPKLEKALMDAINKIGA